MKLFKECLQVNDPEKEGGSRYSLSRVCLLLSFLFMSTMLLLPIAFPNLHTHYELATDTFVTLIFLFSAYSFGNKAFKRYQDLRVDIETIKTDKKS